MRDPDELIQYFLVNEDVPMSSGKTAAQVAHAATLTFIRAHAEHPMRVLTDGQGGQARFRLEPIDDGETSAFMEWFNVRMKKVVLRAPGDLLLRLEAEGHIAIRDAGFTEVDPGTLTVVGLPPMSRSDAAPLVGGLKTLR